MPDPLPSPPEPNPKKGFSDYQVLSFVILLCVVCGLLLALISFSLLNKQTAAKEFDQSKQMLIAAKILNHGGFFEILTAEGELLPARYDSSTKLLVPLEKGSVPPKASEEAIKEIASLRIRPLLTDKEGHVFTLEEKKVSLADYLSENKKTGFAGLPLKLLYAILPNTEEGKKTTSEDITKDLGKADTYVIPVSGFGLWAPIYGFIAIGPDGDEVIGTTWYEHAETPGLGANIAEPWWQKQFYGKEVFEESSDGKTDFQTANMGIIVVKGKVKDVFGNSPKSKSAVDGMSGATLTGDGVTQAYRNSLTAYRAFLIQVKKAHPKEKEHP